MPTYLELAQEPEWRAEFVPPNLQILVDRLRAHYGVSAAALGCKGDNKHLRGYHRSRNWIKNSIYCTNHTYSVTETSGNKSGGDGDWLCGLDATIPHAELIAACQRLDAAVRAGQLEKITEWYGNDDGDDRVDGYNNIENRVATSDPSHLWHLHMSFDRGRANEDHTDLFDILTGADMPTAEEIATAVWVRDVESDTAIEPAWRVLDKAGEDAAAALAGVNEIKVQLAAIMDALGQVPPPGEVTVSAASQTAIATETVDVFKERL